ncbi:MAG: hypothetical protein LBH21_08600 [Gracilibacteraceae bacterium]|jgi:hypothetical protein|nr:hypothetical protein [Gracilibacteraceae bacterium]
MDSSVPAELGNTKKAFLVIHRDEQTEKKSDVATLAERALSIGAGAGGAEISQAFGGGERAHVMQVQYNPASIMLRANAASIPARFLQQNLESEIPAQFTRPPSVVMSVQLLFDAFNAKDSFTTDKFRFSTGDVLTTGATLYQGKKLGRNYSVQPQINALTALLLREQSNLVTFHWANMSFCGIASEAQAQYTTFSVSGRPVRGTVRLSLTQDVEQSAMTYWNDAFDKVFGDSLTGGDAGVDTDRLIGLIGLKGQEGQ